MEAAAASLACHAQKPHPHISSMSSINFRGVQSPLRKWKLPEQIKKWNIVRGDLVRASSHDAARLTTR